jgi:thiol-disulfide isomerase/thioredoxin
MTFSGRSAVLLLLACFFLVPGLVAAEEQTLIPVQQRPLAPDFVLKDAEGKSHRLSEYRGKVVALNFWATWCPPCRREMPSMQRLKDQMDPDQFVILAIDVGEDDETVFAFIFALDVPIDYPLLLDTDGAVTDQWPILGLPTSFVLDRSGRVVLRAVGGRLWDDPEFAQTIKSLITEK